MWLDFIKDLLEVCIVPILGVVATYVITFIEKKKEEMLQRSKNETLQKYINLLGDLIVDCVAMTNQTYVEALKDQDMFNEQAQKEAFRITFNSVKNLLTEEARTYLTEGLSDLDSYIEFKIEAEVKKNKGTV